MSYFASELVATAVEDGWRLERSLVYSSDFLGRKISVPRHYFTDLASVPRIFRFIVPVANAKNRKASVLHDYLCTHGESKNVTQRQADIVFREALGVCGIGRIRSGLMYHPVRAYQWAKGLFRRAEPV
ncbi:MAG: hypothetical protein COA78_25215 [Blastopirellula sp.]|nr:MAG: hypothetical protein COA78_25215 [Blastopirellula sp.]